MIETKEEVDVVLIGGGIMSATLGAMLAELEPQWSVRLYERLGYVAKESSDPWNNAGTGHAAYCELNYTPADAAGNIDITKAVNINEQFQVSRQFWSYLVDQGIAPQPEKFIRPVPHISYGQGEDGREYIKSRYETMVKHPLFADMEYTEDRGEQAEWLPLMFGDRGPGEVNAISRSASGTDVDFGALTKILLEHCQHKGAHIRTHHKVLDLNRTATGWAVVVKDTTTGETFEVRSKFVFIGAGGASLSLLQKSRIAESYGYGGFPVSGMFLRTDNPDLVSQHHAKVYGRPKIGAPPMSLPHLDTRVVNGKEYLMFGPFAGFSPKFLKTGAITDLPMSVRRNNLAVMMGVAKDNFALMKFLVGEIAATQKSRFAALSEFLPTFEEKDWELITAGQRVQVMKQAKGKMGQLAFGTELISAADGSLAALLGASPGASTAPSIMLNLLQKCFPRDYDRWGAHLRTIIPSLGRRLSDDNTLRRDILEYTARTLGLAEPPTQS